MPRHAHEDALSEAEFEQLVDGAKLLEPPLNLEVRTAQKYIRLTGSRTKQALQRVYN